MPIVKDLVQVLRVHEYRSSSLVLVLLGRRLGPLRVLAKGARRWTKKGFAGGFDLLTRGEIVLYPRRDEALWIFKEWDERFRAPELGRGVETLQAASYLCELSEALTRETSGSAFPEGPALREAAPDEPPDPEGPGGLFDRLAWASEALAAGTAPGAVLLAFSAGALESAGLGPGLSCCSRCGKDLRQDRRPARLSHEGLECGACLARARVPHRSAGILPAGERSAGILPAVTRAASLERAGVENRALDGAFPAAADVSPSRTAWLGPELLGALGYIQRSGKSVRLSRPAAQAAARALVVLVQSALERDLRTLKAAAQAVRRLGPES